MDQNFNLSVNGQTHSVTTDPQRRLLDVLREDLQLTGTKYGCGEGQCRCCTVLIDGDPAIACMTPVSVAAGREIVTIEGLAASSGQLHPLQEAFLIEGFQCGYCATGMIMMGSALLKNNPRPTDNEIKQFMGGNLCRCANYEYAVRAVRRASGQTMEELPVK